MQNLARKLSTGAVVTLVAAGLAVPAAFAASGSARAHVSLSAAGSSAASSSTSSGGGALAAIQAKAAAAISLRESRLQVAVTNVGANRYLTSADRSAILSVLTTDQSDLTTLGSTIQSDTTAAQAEADYRTIFTTYRVFALRLPQARFAEAADDLTGTVIPRLTDAQSRLEALLSGPDASKDSASVQASMSDLNTQIGTITSDTSGVAATVLAITPAQWNADQTILSTPRSQLVSARAAAHSAKADVASVVAALQ